MWRSPTPRLWASGFFAWALLLSPVPGAAHDLWVVAGKYRLDPEEVTRVFVNSGDQFPQSLTLVGAHRVTELTVHGPDGKEPVADFRVDGASLSFEMSPNAPGSHVLALGTRARRVRMKSSDFSDYLEENGLDAIARQREELGEGASAVQERYAKWAKAFVDVGDPEPPEEAPQWAEAVGHTIEIVPDENPNALTAGARLGIRILYEGAPLAGATVTGGKAGGPAGEIRTATDAEGGASVQFLSSGRWYLRTIHMIRVDDDPQLEWESFWCTLTFEVASVP